VSVITLGELALGVLVARDEDARARRVATLGFVESTFAPLPVDSDVAHAWGRIVAAARRAGRRTPVNDCWIAATALVHGLVVVTQDRDYDGLDVPVLRI
jgi:predicted nucleic acid-binding protein